MFKESHARAKARFLLGTKKTWEFEKIISPPPTPLFAKKNAKQLGSVWHKSPLKSRDFYRKYGIQTPKKWHATPPPFYAISTVSHHDGPCRAPSALILRKIFIILCCPLEFDCTCSCCQAGSWHFRLIYDSSGGGIGQEKCTWPH